MGRIRGSNGRSGCSGSSPRRVASRSCAIPRSISSSRRCTASMPPTSSATITAVQQCGLSVDPSVRHQLQQQYDFRSPDRRLRPSGYQAYSEAHADSRRARFPYVLRTEQLRRWPRELRPERRQRDRARDAQHTEGRTLLPDERRQSLLCQLRQGLPRGRRQSAVAALLRSAPAAGGVPQRGAAQARLGFHADYDLGSKDVIAHVLRVATSAYYVQWNGIQQGVYVGGNCGLQFTDNLGTAVSKASICRRSSRSGRCRSTSSTGYTNARYTPQFARTPGLATEATRSPARPRSTTPRASRRRGPSRREPSTTSTCSRARHSRARIRRTRAAIPGPRRSRIRLSLGARPAHLHPVFDHLDLAARGDELPGLAGVGLRGKPAQFPDGDQLSAERRGLLQSREPPSVEETTTPSGRARSASPPRWDRRRVGGSAHCRTTVGRRSGRRAARRAT